MKSKSERGSAETAKGAQPTPPPPAVTAKGARAGWMGGLGVGLRALRRHGWASTALARCRIGRWVKNLRKSKNCKKLKVIARHGVGYDNVDTNYIKENNITLLVTHNSTSTSPAEHIMFMILNIYKGREMFDQMVRDFTL